MSDEEEKVDCAATASCIDEIDEETVDEEGYELSKDPNYVDVSELDPGDVRLFPNMSEEYVDTIKWLINPKDVRIKPPLYIIGDDSNCHEVAEYNCDTLMTTGKIQLGQELDVVSLLSSSCHGMLRVGSAQDDYVKPETLTDKYVLLVCVFAPARWVEVNSRLLCQLRIVSNQLSLAENFEMVIIPKIRKNCRPSEAAFHSLLSAFHGRLFVPFEDDDARDKICQHLNFRGYLKAILVDPCRKVAQDCVSDIVANYYYPYNRNIIKLKYLSPDWIRPPSTLEELEDIYLSSSLPWLLDTSYGDSSLRLHSLSSSRDTTTVGRLRNKLVGLYLYQVGDKLDSLLKVYTQCRQKGLDFHIVVVPMSLFTSLDPLEFHRVALGELQRLIPNTPWWVLPYNAATYSTLFNLGVGLGKDRMITVGPHRKFFVDVHGGGVVHSYGIRAYPFNREIIVRKYELAAQAITLDSLLTHGSINYVVRGGKQVPVADLYDKVVLLYACFQLDYDSYRYKCLFKWYKEITKQHSDFEVVVVYYEKPEDSMIENEKHSSPGIDLLIRPFDPKHSRFLREHKSFFMGNNGHGYPLEGLEADSMLLFGKGGHLCSLNALGRFSDHGLDAYPYRRGCGYNMRGEITLLLGHEFDFMSGYGAQKPYDVVSL